MQIFQDGSSINPSKPDVPSSPVRQLYGKKTMPDGTVFLIAPLDIVLMEYKAATDTEVFAPPAPTGALISYNIVTPGGIRVGTIIDYDFPPSLLNLKPVVLIDPPDNPPPNSTVDLIKIPEIGTSVLPAISVGATVTLVDSEDIFLATGTLLSTTPANFSGYPNGSFGLVNAFKVNFGSLQPQVNGARVLVGGANGSLLGMLITSSLVFPADKI
jgi:hypothetical protein